MRFTTISVAAMALGVASASLSVSVPAGKAVPSGKGVHSIVADVDIDDVIASETEICLDDSTTTKPTGTPKPTEWTTSTLYSTKTYTVSKCPTTVHNCPAESVHVTTEVVSVGVTVCPVTEAGPKPTFSTAPSGGKPPAGGAPGSGAPGGGAPAGGVTPAPTFIGGTGAPVPTKTGTPVTAGAGRVAGASAFAAVAGLVAYLL